MSKFKRQLFHCCLCGKKRKVEYKEEMFYSHMLCSVCGNYLGRIEHVRINPDFEWTIKPGTRPSEETVKELGL